MVALVEAFLAGTGASVCLAGRLYQSERLAAARMRLVAAVLSQPGPVVAVSVSPVARWHQANSSD